MNNYLTNRNLFINNDDLTILLRVNEINMYSFMNFNLGTKTFKYGFIM